MINMSLDDRSGRIRHDSSVPVATQVARDIEEDIKAGRIAPDTRLPSEVDLSEQYGVARMTVRRAVAQLRDKGLVVTVHGRGSFVSVAPVSPTDLAGCTSHGQEPLAYEVPRLAVPTGCQFQSRSGPHWITRLTALTVMSHRGTSRPSAAAMGAIGCVPVL